MENLIGVKKSMLTVLNSFKQKEGKMGNNRTMLTCQCDCGKNRVIASNDFKRGTNMSCGCEKIERTSKQNYKDGRKKLPEYPIWGAMIQRCYNPKSKAYKHYGGRGISVCDSWRNDFANFLSDMGKRPDGLTIERIDNNGNYEHGNCKWATVSEQNSNTRRSIKNKSL